MAIRQQELVGLSQQTALKLEQTLQTYNQNKAELEAIAVKQQKITKNGKKSQWQFKRLQLVRKD